MSSSPFLFFTTVLLALLSTMGEATQPYVTSNTSHINYTTVTGFFLQDDPATNASTFDYTKVNLGLINRTYPTDGSFDPAGQKTQWERFANYVSSLNRNASANVQYKVLIMGRHGEGDHNVAESFYGTPAWDCYWSLLDGNGTVTWADAHLTQKGIDQALVANSFWSNALANAGIPAPESYYVSPLARCLATANLTFSGLELPEDKPFKPLVKELLREALGLHTCDRRSTKTWIEQNFPDFPIEPGFTEEDPLWSATLRESSTAQVARLKTLLDDVFTHDANTFISFTSHSGSIGSILKAVSHRTFSLVTGAVIPVLVKAETLPGPAPPTTIDPPTTAPTCTADHNPTTL
ncbi:putative phosphoglycerate mutase protein [Neofusicoccum parvum]|uniref:Phosphoglycerate mutase protein n=1 Tax=Neofusicoccum parvum TaxID=310453 RepID=A0ACB5RNL1_9PEZI|nr:putative phosphoglycerate mutase protein [Neofusicoccum parvum]